jgi:Histone H1-like nucleoprotein HC2/S1 RNA binding domain/Zc3h12a-like Ribonuclease NYN domain
MKHTHLVVDGSNIATEGRDRPSLAQLDEAVRSFLAERPYEKVTVVVDATFGHRIEKKERKPFEAAAASNELVTPPAGAVGRGDAWVLQIADKVKADVLSNDSFQEFHGTYNWLFDEGRLYGGKPVPEVGWVFVTRSPVRGPASRKSVRDAGHVKKKKPAEVDAVVKAAMTERRGTVEPVAADASNGKGQPKRKRERAARQDGKEPLNEPLVYASFVVNHPVGAIVEGTIEGFSSHGAYARVGSARCYLPLKVLGDPPPRSAREVVKIGETRQFVVDGFNPSRRGIDLSLAAPGLESTGGRPAAEAVAPAAEETTQGERPEEAPVSPTAKKATAKRSPAKKSTAKKATAKRSPAKKTTAKSTSTRKSTAKRAPAKKTTAKKSTAKTTTARKSTAKKTAARKSPARKTTAKKTTAKKTTAKRAPASRAATKK